jgi:hypothetical protein
MGFAMKHVFKRLTALFALAVFSISAYAQTYTYSIYVDSDNNSATGCTASFPGGNITGADSVLTATVSASATPQVGSVTRSTCSAGSFGSPVTVGSATAVGVGAGNGGTTSIEFSDTLAALAGSTATSLRLYVVAQSAVGSDVLLTTNGTAGGAAIVLAVGSSTPPPNLVPTPLIGIPAALLLIALLLALGSRAVRRRLLKRMLLGLVLLSGVAGAAIFNWTGINPLATDPAGDSTSGESAIDLRYLYAVFNSGNLYFRLDVTGNLGIPASPPVAVADSYTTALNTALNTPAPGVLGNDTVNGATISANTNPTHGSLVLNGNGGFVYTPASGYTGSDSFSYTLTNSGGSSTATVSLNISAGPVAIADNYTTTVGAALTIAAPGVLGNDQLGAPAATLSSFGGGSLGGVVTDHAAGTSATLAGASLTVNADGSISLAAPTTAGTYTFQYRIGNSQGTADGTVTVQVNQAPTITSANTTTFLVGTAGTFSVTTTGTPNAALTETGALPSGVTFVDNGNGTATLAGTPAAGGGGNYPLTLAASNGTAPNATQSFTLVVQQAPAITSANATAFSAGVAGSFTVTATGNPVPTLSETGSLPTGVTFNAATGVLGGTPAAGTNGSYPITFTASNGVGSAAVQSFTLTVSAGPAITSANTTTFTVGTAGTFTVTTTGTPNPAVSETGALPGGVSFLDNGNGTATLAGTPAAGSGGSYALTITASNGVGSAATQSFTLVVQQAPAITSANATAFSVGAAGSFSVTATGTPAPGLTETGTLPSGVAFNSATGVLSGTPAAGTTGTYPITFTASNGVGSPAIQSFTLTVNIGPAITSANTTTFIVGSAGTFTVISTGTPSAALTETGALPSGVTFVDNGSGTATLAGTPAAGTAGSYALTFTASNGVGSPATQSFTLIVNQTPGITSASTTTFTVGTAGTFTVTATGVPAPSLSASGSLPGGVTFNTATGVLGGTPNAGTGGSYPITITASNGVLPNATQSFTLVVNEAPAITSANATTFIVGSAGTFTVIATGTPAPTFSETGALPSGVTLTAAGLLAGTPAAGTGGSYPVTITATNGVLPNATQSFTLQVNQAPAITSLNTTTFVVGTPGTFTVLATGTPAPTFSETGALPSGVTLTSAGILAGTPAAGTGGSYPITITAANGVLPNATQSFTLIVNQAPAFTSANNATFPIGTLDSFTVTATGFPAPTFSETGALPTGVTLSTGGALAGTPGPGTAGIYPLTLSASNGVGGPVTQAFTLTVLCPTITVSGTLPNGLYQTAYGPQTFTQTGGAPTIAWTAPTLPASLTINSATGVVSGTPNNTVAAASVTVTATDVNLCTGSLTINNFKIAPVALADSYSTVGNTQLYVATAAPTTPVVTAATAVTANDNGPLPIASAITAPAGHGTANVNGNGSFVYTPVAGYSGADSFTYTLTDGNGVTSAPATVSITVTGRVWYVNGAAGPGTGVSNDPFGSLASASTAHLAGDTIFVESAGAPTPTSGAISLKASSFLWGQGTALPTISSIAIQNTGATTKPLLSNTVTLAGNSITVSSLDIASTTNTGLTNTGTITGATVQNNVSVTTTTGTAVNLANASGAFSFRSISSTGATHGISLASVGGSFLVSGDGAAASNGSGGVLLNSVGEGVLYNGGGAALTLQQMNVTSSGTGSTGALGNTGSGIKVTGGSGFILSRANVTDTAGGGVDEGVYLINTGGAISITNSTITGAPHNGVRVDNTSVNIASFGLTNSTIGSITNNGSTTFGNDGLLFDVQGTTVVTSATIQGNTFSGIFATAIQAQSGGTANIQNMTIGGAAVGQPNTFSGNNIALDLDQDVSSQFTFNVLNNTLNSHHSHAINVFSTTTSTGGTLTGKIDANHIGTAGTLDSGSAIGNGMRLNINGLAHAVMTISNNVINEVPNGRGIEMVGRLGTGGANFKAVSNTVARPSGTNQNIGCGASTPCPLSSIYASTGTLTPSNTVCTIISGNTAYDPTSWAVGAEAAYALVNNTTGGVLRIEGSQATPSAQITTTNTVTNNTGSPVLIANTVNVVAAGTCGTFP